MFTGIVEELGAVEAALPEGPGILLQIRVSPSFDGVRIGDSVAVNGCCLTVVQLRASAPGWELSFQAGEETLSRTNLGSASPGERVNLERAMRADSRVDGHWVTGHIDAVGRVAERIDSGDWCEMWFAAPIDLTRQMVSKGSVAVDGVSLTLVDVQRDRFSVALIPHTLEVTTLGQRRVGEAVNLETDMMAKYIQRQWEVWRESFESPPGGASSRPFAPPQEDAEPGV